MIQSSEKTNPDCVPSRLTLLHVLICGGSHVRHNNVCVARRVGLSHVCSDY